MASTVLLADDSNTIRKIVELAFAESETRVLTAASGAEALALLDSERPDLLLADVVMPEPDGYELCRRVKDSARPLPVILLAGTFEPFDRRRAWDSGADDHLVKPFESQLLRRKVEALLSGGKRRMVATGLERLASDAPSSRSLSPAEIDAIAQRVIERLTSDTVAGLVRESLPEIAERVVRERIRELEAMDE